MIKSESKENTHTGRSLIPVTPAIEERIRIFSKSELAVLYHLHPDTLTRNIKSIPELTALLDQTGYNKWKRSYTKEQVRLIIQFLGEPDFPY